MTITSTTIVHDQLFLVDKEGKEIAVKLQNWDVACRDGNIVTVMWAIMEGKSEGPYFAIINHSTGSKVADRKIISNIARSCLFGKVMTLDGNLGCLFLIAMLALVVALFAIWWPLGLAIIGLGVYAQTLVTRNVRMFNSEVQYPTIQPW